MPAPALHFRSRRLGPGEVVHDCWLEQPFDDGWVAAFRLVPQNGYPSVAEFRFFPRSAGDQSASARDNDPGEWAAARQGFTASVPPGGLTARRLKSVKFGAYLDDVTTILRRMERKWGYEAVHGERRLFTRYGFTPASSQSVGRAGRPRIHDDLFLAILAHDYVRAFTLHPSAPVQALRTARKYSTEHLRELIHTARDRGMLTSPPKPGVGGGNLTSLAFSILRAAREDQR